MAFEAEKFVDRFNTVWNGHDVDGILDMMNDDVVFEASFGKEMWGHRLTARRSAQFLDDMFERIRTSAGTSSGTSRIRSR